MLMKYFNFGMPLPWSMGFSVWLCYNSIATPDLSVPLLPGCLMLEIDDLGSLVQPK